MNTAQASVQWSIEIETAVISTLWQQPQRLAEFLRVHDPLVHLTQPHLRLILDAINLSYGELGIADWATVVQVVRELGAYEDCGDLDGLNPVYTAVEITPVIDPIYAHHLSMLQLYAEHRTSDPPRAMYRFTGGRGTAYRVKAKRRPLDADFSGEATVRGIKYQVSIQLASDGSAMNLRLEPK